MIKINFPDHFWVVTKEFEFFCLREGRNTGFHAHRAPWPLFLEACSYRRSPVGKGRDEGVRSKTGWGLQSGQRPLYTIQERWSSSLTLGHQPRQEPREVRLSLCTNWTVLQSSCLHRMKQQGRRKPYGVAVYGCNPSTLEARVGGVCSRPVWGA